MTGRAVCDMISGGVARELKGEGEVVWVVLEERSGGGGGGGGCLYFCKSG